LAIQVISHRYPNYGIEFFDNGTSALQQAVRVALSGTDPRRPELVAVPAWACPDIGTAVLAAGAGIVLFDVHADTLEPDIASVRWALELGARVVIVPHFFGRLADIPSFLRLAAKYGAAVIEDAAQHAGGRLSGQVGGSFGDLSVLSFGRGKGLNAGGGGALLRRCGTAFSPRSPSTEAITPPTWTRIATLWGSDWLSHPDRFILPWSVPWLRLGETVYHEPRARGAISLLSLQLLPWVLEDEARQLNVRREHEARYREGLAGYPGACITPVNHPHFSGALRMPIRIPSGSLGSPTVVAMRALGVVQSYPRTLLQYEPIRAACINARESFPGAESLAGSLVTLPTHQHVTPQDREVILSALRDVLSEE
jgi:dTDP-4-amino-4,6-dideoxygalactose transaminase